MSTSSYFVTPKRLPGSYVETFQTFPINNLEFGKSFSVDVKNTSPGELLADLFLEMTIPAIDIKNNTTRAAWSEHVGFDIIENMSMVMVGQRGGSSICELPGNVLFTQAMAFAPTGEKQRSLKELAGAIPKLTELSDSSRPIKQHEIQIMLPFGSFRSARTALPVWKFSSSQVTIRGNLRHKEKVIVTNLFEMLAVGGITNGRLRARFIKPLDSRDISYYNGLTSLLVEKVKKEKDEKVEKGNSHSAKCGSEISSPVAIYWMYQNYHNSKFLEYSPNNWEKALELAAEKILLSQFDVKNNGHLAQRNATHDMIYQVNGAAYQKINPMDSRFSFIYCDESAAEIFQRDSQIGMLSPGTVLLGTNGNDLRQKVSGIVKISTERKRGINGVGNYTGDSRELVMRVEKITRNELTMEDLSTPIASFSVDNRNQYAKNQDVQVNCHTNFSSLLDGTGTPLEKATIQDGSNGGVTDAPGYFFDQTIPTIKYPSCPGRGINMYTFVPDLALFSSNSASGGPVVLTATISQDVPTNTSIDSTTYAVYVEEIKL